MGVSNPVKKVPIKCAALRGNKIGIKFEKKRQNIVSRARRGHYWDFLQKKYSNHKFLREVLKA